jgi:hypothetical protein
VVGLDGVGCGRAGCVRARYSVDRIRWVGLGGIGLDGVGCGRAGCEAELLSFDGWTRSSVL